MKDFHDFLNRHSGEGAAESGVFTLDPKRAREQTLEYLRQSSSKFAVHFVAAAHYHGASEVRASSNPKKSSAFSRLRGKEAPRFSLFFDATLSSDQLRALPEALLDHSRPGLQRLSWVLHQLLAFEPSWVRVSSLNQGKGFTLTLTRSKPTPRLQAHSERDPELKGLLVECSRLVISKLIKVRRPHYPPLTALLEELEPVARRSDLRCFLDDERLDLSGPPDTALHFVPEEKLPGGEMQAWLESAPALSEALVVANGVTLPPLPMSARTHGPHWFPGLKLILRLQAPVWDASKLQIVRDEAFEEFLRGALERASDMLGQLAQSEARECRHYLLGNWWRFPHLPLSTYPLFRTLSGRFTSLDQLRAKHRDPSRLSDELEPDDALYARGLYSFEHDFRFSRGGTSAQHYSLCPHSRWLALGHDRRVSFHSLGKPKQSHTPTVELPKWQLSWHPTEPWVALLCEDGARVWDLKLEKELAFFPGQFCALGFSQYGRYLNLYEQEAPRRLAYWKVTVPDFHRAEEPFELPGYNPVAIGNLLLVWQNDRRFQVRHFSDLSTLVQEFSTDCAATRLLDISPCYGLAILGSDSATYLYNIGHQTLRKLLSPVADGLFSWNSDLLFARIDNGHGLIRTHSLVTFPVETPVEHIFRSGIALHLGPGGSHTPRLLLTAAQPSPLQDHRPVFVHRDQQDFERLSVIDEGGTPQEVWRFGTSEAAGLRSVSGAAYLAVSCPDGTRLHHLQSGSTRLARQCIPTGGRLYQRESEGSRFVDPETLQAFLPAIRGHRLRLMHEFLPEEFLVEADGQVLNVHPKAVNDGTMLQQRLGTLEYVRKDEILGLARIENGMLTCTFNQGMEDCPPAFKIPAAKIASSPGKNKLAVLFESAVTILDFEQKRIATRLPNDLDGDSLFWISEQHLFINGVVWRPHPVEEWESPLATPARVPEKVVGIPGTQVAVEANGPEHRLISLTHGNTIAIYRSLAEHWFLFTPQGDWDGSDGCLEYLKPRPTHTPTPQLLKRVLETAGSIDL